MPHWSFADGDASGPIRHGRSQVPPESEICKERCGTRPVWDDLRTPPTSVGEPPRFSQVEQLAQGVAPEAIHAVRVGRLTALRKPDGGVRGIVAGDVVRRLIARTMAQQMTDAVKLATSPYQYALSTRAGCECISHVLQGLTELDHNATVVSIDGISAFDLISRGAMLQALRDVSPPCLLSDNFVATLPVTSGKMMKVLSMK